MMIRRSDVNATGFQRFSVDRVVSPEPPRLADDVRKYAVMGRADVHYDENRSRKIGHEAAGDGA